MAKATNNEGEKPAERARKPYMDGNQFWRLRSKSGPDKIFKSGKMIVDACFEYLEQMYTNPQESVKHLGKDATEKTVYHYRPPSWERFCVFCHVNTKYFNDLALRVDGKTDKESLDIAEGIATVRDIFFSEKFEAASAGLADARLIGNAIGFYELHKVQSVNTNINHEVHPITAEEAKKISEDLDNEL